MIDSKIIDLFSHGVFVIHPSLLPLYRGATPIQSALFNGDRETGISLCEASKEVFDAGRIWIQQKVPIDQTDTYTTVGKTMSDRAAGLVDRL